MKNLVTGVMKKMYQQFLKNLLVYVIGEAKVKP